MNIVCLFQVVVLEIDSRFLPGKIACGFVNKVRRDIGSVVPLPRFLHASSSCGHLLGHRLDMVAENVDARAPLKRHILRSAKATQESRRGESPGVALLNVVG